MIKLMIVDDEIEIRKGISNKINWAGNGILVCGEAGNGREAIPIINETHPDILLVDVRMPIMNGLELVEYLSENRPDIKSIILSGFDDFSYARQALRLGVSEYLLKPCLPDQILETVLKVKTLVEKSNATKEMYNSLKIKLNEALPLLKEKFLVRLIKGEQKNLFNLQEKFNFFKINLQPSNFAVVLICIDEPDTYYQQNNYDDFELIKFALKNITEEVLVNHFQLEVFESDDDIVAIINLENPSDVLPHLNDLKNHIKNFLKLNVTVGLGKPYSDIYSIGLSYEEAFKAVEMRFFLEEDVVISYEDIKQNDNTENIYPINEEKDIINCLNIGKTEVENSLNNFFHALHSVNSIKNAHIKASIALLFSLYHFCIEKGIATEEIFGQDFSLLDEITKLSSIERLKARLLGIINTIMGYINARKGNNKIVESAIKYINTNFMNSLSLEIVAKEVFITPSYLSFLFKQYLGISFVEYLNKARISKASELLKNSNLKTYEISSKVGYSDEKYFSYVFKKYTGMTTTQYREEC